MKRIICLIMVFLFALCALTACKKNGPTIMGNDGATYEQVVDKDGNPVTDPSGNLVVIAPKGTDASGNEQEDATQSLTIPYLASSGKTIESPGYRVDIPKDWEMKSSAADPILENKEETLQISIMDKSAVAKNRKEYAETARNSLMQVAIRPVKSRKPPLQGIRPANSLPPFKRMMTQSSFPFSTLWKITVKFTYSPARQKAKTSFSQLISTQSSTTAFNLNKKLYKSKSTHWKQNFPCVLFSSV